MKGLYTYDLYVSVIAASFPPVESDYTVTVSGGTLSEFFPESTSMGPGNPTGWFMTGFCTYAFTASSSPITITIN
jgi:hypothetical protein